VAPSGTVCDDGTLCPASLVCAPAGGCAEPDQLAACEGRADDAVCSLAGIGDGLCRDGLCIVARCGDGVLDPGEGCDEGEANAPDGTCLPDCKRPTCGDGAVQGDEQCDDGAANGDDRACLPTCVAASCGDGRLRVGVGSTEACDAGVANADTGACTTSCAVATCGDGHIWAGVEACDDANAASGDGCRADCRKVEACGDGALDDGEQCDDANGNALDGCDACAPQGWTPDVVLEGQRDPLALSVGQPLDVAIDAADNLYIADAGSSRVLRIDAATQAVAVVAGTGTSGTAGEGGPATGAQLDAPRAVAVDGLGNVYVATSDRTLRVDARSGVLTRVPGVEGIYVLDLALDGLGNLYTASLDAIYRIAPDGALTTIAGGGGLVGAAGDGGPATAATIATSRLSLDGDRLYFNDEASGPAMLRSISLSTGLLTTIAGGGTERTQPCTLAEAGFQDISGIVARAEVIYVADLLQNVRRVDLGASVVTRFAGIDVFQSGFAGDGGPAADARLQRPEGLVLDRAGNLFIADSYNARIRAVASATGTIDTVVGSGAQLGEAATSSRLLYPSGAAFTAAGEALLGGAYAVAQVGAAGAYEPLAGGYTPGPGVAALAVNTRFTDIRDLAVWEDAVFIAAAAQGALSSSTQHIYRVDLATNAISPWAGTGWSSGPIGDGGPATGATLVAASLVFDGSGNAFVVDAPGFVDRLAIRRIDAGTGVITTVAGGGPRGFADGVATDAKFGGSFFLVPRLALHTDTSLVVADPLNRRVRYVDLAAGTVATIAGDGTDAPTPDAGPLAGTPLTPFDVAVEADGSVLILTGAALYRADSSLTMYELVAGGQAASGAFGDGGAAVDAGLECFIYCTVDVDGGGNVWLGTGSGLGGVGGYRRIDAATGIITTVHGELRPPGTDVALGARLATSSQLAIAMDLVASAGGPAGLVQTLDADGVVRAAVGRYPQPQPTLDLARYRDATFGDVEGVAIDAAGARLFVAETSAHTIHVVAMVDPADPDTWTIAPLAGAATPGSADGPVADARFRRPAGLHFDAASDTLYVADRGNHAIRAIALGAGTVATVAGTAGTLGYLDRDPAGEPVDARDALLFDPRGVTRCAATGDLYIADSGNHRVRRVDAATGRISTVLGDGVPASSGEGTPARSFPVHTPIGIACDAAGNIFVSSRDAVRMLPAAIGLAEVAGVVDGEGPVQTIYGAAPRLTFPESATSCIAGVALADDGAVWLSDACAGIVVALRP
jgi:cysteine-rich repeat protein